VWRCRHCGAPFPSLAGVRQHAPSCPVPWSPNPHARRPRTRTIAVTADGGVVPTVDVSALALAVGRALQELETDRAWLKQRLDQVDRAIIGLQALLAR